MSACICERDPRLWQVHATQTTLTQPKTKAAQTSALWRYALHLFMIAEHGGHVWRHGGWKCVALPWHLACALVVHRCALPVHEGCLDGDLTNRVGSDTAFIFVLRVCCIHGKKQTLAHRRLRMHTTASAIAIMRLLLLAGAKHAQTTPPLYPFHRNMRDAA